MARVVFELAGFFFLPFLAYAAFLVVSQKNPAAVKQMFERKPLLIQSFIGLLAVALVLLILGFSDQPHIGGYSPAVFKDGKLIPGSVK